MRLLAIVPFLCAVTSFVLAMLCLFAGSSPGYLENVDLLTLNTSMLGEFAINTTSTSGSHSLGTWLNGLEGSAEGDINSLVNDVAKSLNIHDFYSVHMMDYCEGYFTPGAIANATSTPSRNVTACSNRTALYTFDPTAILQSELKSGVSLSDLKWPQAITDAIGAVQIAMRATFVIYCIAIGLAGVAFVGAFFGVLVGGRLSALMNLMLDFFAFLTLGIASAISTATSVKVVDAINQYGSDIGIAASKGTTFITYTWVATALMFLAMVVWVVEFCVGRKKQVAYERDGKEGRM